MSYKKFSNEEDRYQFLKHSSDLHKDTAENDPITVTPIVTGQETSHTLNLPRPGKYVRKPLFSCESNYLQWCIPSLLTPAASLGSAFMMHRYVNEPNRQWVISLHLNCISILTVELQSD